MAASACVQKTLNPCAEEFTPTVSEKDLVPSLPNQIFHPIGNELVVYQPPPPQGNELVVYQAPAAVLPVSFPQPLYWICYADVHVQACYQQQVLSLPERSEHQEQPFFERGDEVFVRKTWRRCEKRGAKRPFLPPRMVRAAAAERTWRQQGSFMRKPHQEVGSFSSKKCPLLVKEGPFFSNNLTTVMIRNIPNQFRRGQFILFLDHYCSMNHWEYDFLYLPIDFGTRNNVGYAFVNFTSGRAASEIRKVLKNFKWHGVMTSAGIYSSRKICEVTWARIQGKEHLVKHFLGSSFVCETDDYLPVVFSPPRNGSTRLTKPRTIGKRAAGPSVSSSPPSCNDN